MRVDGFHIFDTMREKKACDKRMVSRGQRKFNLSVGSRGGRTDRLAQLATGLPKPRTRVVGSAGRDVSRAGGARFLSSST